MSADYLDSLVADAVEYREAHGGKVAWWVSHDRAVCAACWEMDRKLTKLYGPLTKECPYCGARKR